MSSANDLVELVQASNALGRATYQRAFDFVRQTPEGLAKLDLLCVQTPHQCLPALKNGTNRYFDAISNPSEFDFVRFMDCGVTPDLFIIIPEATNILREFVSGDSIPKSCLWDILKDDRCPVWFQSALPDALNVDDCLRAFDSHLSVAYYRQVVIQAMGRLGGRTDAEFVEYSFRPYPCDLARRFSDLSTTSLFVHNRHFVSETGADGQSGRIRTFRNPSAPNRQAVALVGDSHSFSAISQILSYYYESVTFYWANRASGYGKCADAINQDLKHADIVIEESAERFLVRNFASTLPPVQLHV